MVPQRSFTAQRRYSAVSSGIESNESLKEKEAMLLLGESSSSDESTGELLQHRLRRASSGASSLVQELLVPEVETEEEKQKRLQLLQYKRDKARRKREKQKRSNKSNKSVSPGSRHSGGTEAGRSAGWKAHSGSAEVEDVPQRGPPTRRRSSNRPMTFAEAKRMRESEKTDSGLSGGSRRGRNMMSMSSRRLINSRDAEVRRAWKLGPLYAMAVLTDGRHFGDVAPLLGCTRPLGARASTVCDM